ncbi:hypothetical protein FA15DRAFT_587820 [Coprinopsis marcescibilis]|uniref:Roadblock/LAMTOR2 domain-containing protein n=1 Tax=Coprinopsis marcescibilis TaxID=230819 RepID=A0A5C3L206_COPMA|nr:hypothetical protein FA15DRAFT_587820 [Coprinopsis marcescibilis]
MLVLSKLQNTLSRILSFPDLHTAVLLTVSGELVSFAADPVRPKDDIRVIAGLASEIWRETKEQGYGIVDSEDMDIDFRQKFGRIAVLPVDDEGHSTDDSEGGAVEGYSEDRQPLMLLALNANENTDLDEIRETGLAYARHLSKPMSRFRPYLAVKPAPLTPSALSPTPARV